MDGKAPGRAQCQAPGMTLPGCLAWGGCFRKAACIQHKAAQAPVQRLSLILFSHVSATGLA